MPKNDQGSDEEGAIYACKEEESFSVSVRRRSETNPRGLPRKQSLSRQPNRLRAALHGMMGKVNWFMGGVGGS